MRLNIFQKSNLYVNFLRISRVKKSTVAKPKPETARSTSITVRDQTFPTDDTTNITPHIISLTERQLHLTPYHPLTFLKLRIRDYFYANYKKPTGNPLYSLFDNFSPVVSVQENFDTLLVPADHPSRATSDSYYINSSHLLRSHTSAHQHALFKSGLDHFLVVGDVYRRDVINHTHFPCFHQMEGASIFDDNELRRQNVGLLENFQFFESGQRSSEKQESHTKECSKIVEQHLKTVLEGLVRHLFGSDVTCRWTETYFPFTHPSWELEVLHDGEWLECLGCGVIEQALLKSAGVGHKVGWAFGLGLDRLAMKLYSIPDIRIFWSRDASFLMQFKFDDYNRNITFKPFSKSPPCINDISFWLPDVSKAFSENDFYDLVRAIGHELVEQVNLVDDFTHPKTKRQSHCYRIIYRHPDRALSQEEVNEIHTQIANRVVTELGGTVR